MKYSFAFVLAFSLSPGFSFSQNENLRYDPALAERLAADQYGMKSYIFVILKSGDKKTDDKAFRDSCFAGHLQNIDRLAKEGRLIVAGPFGKNDEDMRGLFILNTASKEEATEMLETDPAIHAGLLKPYLYPWYGSAALPEYLDAADRIWMKQP